jgi:hypothetical protein
MVSTGNRLTEKAQDWVRDYLFNKGFTDKNNPFYNVINGDLHLQYDEIRISNFAKIDGVGVNVNYYWKGWKCCIFPVNNISLDTAPAINSLNLNGIAGSMKMVIIDDNQIT